MDRIEAIDQLLRDRRELVGKLGDIVDPRRIADLNMDSRKIKANQILQAIEQIDDLIKAIKPEKWV